MSDIEKSPVQKLIEDDYAEETFVKHQSGFRENPNHIAGAQKISVSDAIDIRVADILNALWFPNAVQLVKNYSYGIWEWLWLEFEDILKRAEIDFEKTAEHFLDFLGVPISSKEATRHFLICGTTGSGKTVLIKYLMWQALIHVGYGRNQRAIVYDPGREFVPFLYSLYDSKNELDPKPEDIVKIFNPYDFRCVAWDISKDIRTKTEAKVFASIIIPKTEGEKSPFFAFAAQRIVAELIYSFILTSQQIERESKEKAEQETTGKLDWSLYDICVAFNTVFKSVFSSEITELEEYDLDVGQNAELAKAILEKHPLTKSTINYVKRGDGKDGNDDVLLTLVNHLDNLEAIAAAWEGKERISLREWLKDEKGQVLVLGRSAENKVAIEALNSAMVQFVGVIVLDSENAEHKVDMRPIEYDRDDYLKQKSYDELLEEKEKGILGEIVEYAPRTWLFLDEFANLKIDGMQDFLTEGRKKGICAVLSFQNYASIQKNYEKLASVITSCCNFKVFLQSLGEAAKWIAETIGKERAFEESFAKTNGTSETETTTTQTGQSNAKTTGGSSLNSTTKGTQSSTSQSYSFTRSQSSTVNITIQERDLVMKENIESLKSANEHNGLEGYVKFSEVAGKIWKFHYDWSVVDRILSISTKEKDFLNRIEIEGTEFLNPRPFTKADFKRLGLDYEKYEKAILKRQQRIADKKIEELDLIKEKRGYLTDLEQEDYDKLIKYDLDRERREEEYRNKELRDFIDKVNFQGYISDLDKKFYQGLSKLEKKTVNRHLNIDKGEDEEGQEGNTIWEITKGNQPKKESETLSDSREKTGEQILKSIQDKIDAEE